jgi:hypothetical protein
LHCRSPVDSKLANISTLGFVDTGDDVMIGPSLTNAGVAIEIPIFARNLAEYFGQYPCEWPQMTSPIDIRSRNTERPKRMPASTSLPACLGRCQVRTRGFPALFNGNKRPTPNTQ